METLTQVADAMQYILQEVADELGQETGFIQRKRKFSGASFVQALVFGWLAKADSTMEELSQAAANVGVQVSRQGVDERFNAAAAQFLQRMVEETVKCVLRRHSVTTAIIKRFNGVYVEDSTVLKLPAILKDIWAGCNDSALKISVRWDLQHGGLEQVQLHPGREHDQQAQLHDLPLPVGALQLRDIGYFDLETMRSHAHNGSYWVMRYKVGTLICTSQVERIDLLALLKQTGKESIDCEILLGAQARLPCRLVAQVVPATVLAQRQKRLKQWERKHQKRASEEKWALLGWSIYVTNAPVKVLTATEVFEVAHLRWQIELLFKLWKSELRLDEWRSEKPWRILCEIYAKLIAIVIQHWLILLGDGHHLRKSLTQMSRTVQKKAWHLASVLSQRQALIQALSDIDRCFNAGCRISPSSSSPPTFQRFHA
jgi:Transposase DDE domain